MLDMTVKNLEFRFNYFVYKKTDCVAMRSPLGPVLANIFVTYFESILFKNIDKSLNYFRYVDDFLSQTKKAST